MTETITYRLFGIPLWSVTRKVSAGEVDALYTDFMGRFERDLAAAYNKVRSGGAE